MAHARATVLVGFGSVAAGMAADRKMAEHVRYRAHAQVLLDHPRYDWQAVVDPDAKARDAARRGWNVPLVAPDLGSLPPGFAFEAAVVATPPAARLAVLEQLPEGAVVLVEKPLGTTLAEARAVAEACARRKLVANVNLFRRADAANLRLRGGEFARLVGTVQFAIIVYGRGLRTNALHMIDLLRMLAGEVAAARAAGPVRPPADPALAWDAECSAVLELENGAPVFLAPIDFRKYREVLLDFWGTEGRLEIFRSGLALRHSRRRPHRAMENTMEIAMDAPEPLESGGSTALYDLYSNLAEAADGTAAPACPPSEALRSEAVVDALLRSAAEAGRRVELAELGGRL